MSVQEITLLVLLAVSVLSGVATIIVAIIRGEMKKFVVEKMEEAEQSGKSGVEKLQFVLDAVKEKYKVLQIILNIQEFVEKIIDITKKIN